MLEFPMILKQLRISKGLTQKKLSEAIEISPSTLVKYERGEREPNIATLKKIASYFNVSIDYLLGFKELENTTLMSKWFTLTSDEQYENNSFAKKLNTVVGSQLAALMWAVDKEAALEFNICNKEEVSKMSYDEINETISKCFDSWDSEKKKEFTQFKLDLYEKYNIASFK